MDKLIYLASPYSSEFADVTERRVRQVESAAAHFIEKGHLIFSPIVNSHPIAELVSFSGQNTTAAMSPWMKYDHAMIDRSDELWVLMIEGWDKSLGVTEEIDYALKQGKTIRYIEYPTFRETGNISRGKGYVSAYFQALGRTRRTPFTPRFATWEGYKIPDAFKNLFEPKPDPRIVLGVDVQSPTSFNVSAILELTDEGKEYIDKIVADLSEAPFFIIESDTTYHEPIPQADGDGGEFFSRPGITGTFEFKKVFEPATTGGAFTPPTTGKPYSRIIVDEPGFTTYPCKDCQNDVEVTTVRCGECVKAIQGDYGRIEFVAPDEPRIWAAIAARADHLDDKPAKAKQVIIGLNGYAQTGKDTVGKKLIDDYGFVRVSFADPIYEALYALNPRIYDYANQQRRGVDDAYCWRLRNYVDYYGWETMKVKNTEVRELLQRLGTEVGRDVISKTVWLDIARRKIEKAYPNPVVITDCRFENEAEFVKALGGKVVNVQRQGVNPVNGHSSDKPINKGLINYTVNNNGSLSDLHEEIDLMMECI